MIYKALFSVLIFAGLFYFVGFEETWAVLSNIRLEYVFYLALISYVLIWVSCVKWRLFIRAAGHDANIHHLVNLYTIGYFINTFTPSFVAGDVVRSLHLGEKLSDRKVAFASTFLERFTGLLAMCGLGVLFIIVGAEATKGVELAVCIVSFPAFVFSLFCFQEKSSAFFFGMIKKVLGKFPGAISTKAISFLEKANEGMKIARNNPKLFFHAMWLSVVYHMCTVVNTYICARAIGWENPDIKGLFVVVPLVLIFTMVPLTPNGLGIQEGAFLFLLQKIGATKAEGLGVGLVLRAKVVVLALVGGVLWTLLKKNQKAEAVTAETLHGH